MSNKKPPQTPTLNDLNAWINETHTIAKISKKQLVSPPLKPLPKVDERNVNKKSKVHFNDFKHQDLIPNEGDGLDRSTFEKIKRGKMYVDAVLDLHGLTQDQAFQQFESFVTTNFNAQKRLLLIIVGKGKKSAEGKGVLRETLPSWVNTPALRPLILNMTFASQKDGGEGAYYVYLKRIRPDKK